MEWVPDSHDEKGIFTFREYHYARAHSAMRVFDYDVAEGIRVIHFLQVLQQQGRDKYRMTGSGVGCRFWV